MSLTAMTELKLSNKRVLIREDLNVPIRDGLITSDKRLQAALPTIKLALEKNAAVILLSHLGRPTEGEFNDAFSLQPVANYLSKALGQTVPLVRDYLNGVDVAAGQVVLCENVRFNVGETSNDESLSKQLASLADIFVMDAFGTAHRAHASTCGVASFIKTACAGPLLMAELEALEQVMKAPKHPIVAIVGGSKVSSKLALLKKLAEKVDILIVGGGIANTFLKASGVDIGNSLFEESLLTEAKALLDSGKTIPLAKDVVVAKELCEITPAYNKALNEIAEDDMILDMGPETVDMFIKIINTAGTIIWNGPIGVFECAPFSYGTRELAFAIADSDAFSIAGGGDTLAAIDKYNLSEKISYISTGGGAFLEFLQGKKLPAVTSLEQRTCKEDA